MGVRARIPRPRERLARPVLRRRGVQVGVVETLRVITPEVAARFGRKINKSEACWIWTDRLTDRGYGQLWINGKYVQATHVAWYLEHGSWPSAGMFVCHECDNPACVRPSHLFLCLPKENTQDMYRKGRSNPPRGERQPRHKLTALSVREIKRRYNGGESQASLAREYGVHPSQISRVVRGQSWPSASS